MVPPCAVRGGRHALLRHRLPGARDRGIKGPVLRKAIGKRDDSFGVVRMEGGLESETGHRYGGDVGHPIVGVIDEDG